MSEAGMITKIWGPSMWTTLHTITFAYPLCPTDADKKNYKEFFTVLGNVLPCKLCQTSYNVFIKEGVTLLDDHVMESRDNLTKWLYYVHNAVNKKLDVDYGVTYEDIVNKYGSFRAKCNKDSCAVNTRSESYKVASNKDCPIVPYEIAKQFIEYALMRGLSDVVRLVDMYRGSKCGDKLWIVRNKECCDIIKNMRENDIGSVEIDGEWCGLPTIDETKLIMRLSSNLGRNDLAKMTRLLPKRSGEYKKIYKLVK